jgi:hypothetical protein
MAQKTPPSFLLNQSNPIDTDKSIPLFDQLKPPTVSDVLPVMIANFNTPNYLTSGPKIVKVVKVFNISQPRPGSTLDLESRNNFQPSKAVQHCMAIANDLYGAFVPLPTEVSDNNIQDQKSRSIIKQSIYCYDSYGLLKNGLKIGDQIPVEFVTPTEARIVGDVTKNDIVSQEENNTTNTNNSDGTTVGDSKQNTSPTGDLQSGNDATNIDCKLSNHLTTFTPKPLIFRNDTCGNNEKNKIDQSIIYKVEKCKTDTLPNGQIVSLHSKFFEQVSGLINDLINDSEIIASGYKIAISSGYRTLEGQKYARRLNCPQAVAAGASDEELYLAKWQDLLKKYKCQGPEASPAIRTRSHLTGMAVDFVLDYTGGYKNAEDGKPCFGFVVANSLIYKKLKQYATKHKLTNYSREPWHWSSDGS